MARSKVRGRARVQRLLKAIPQVYRNEIVDAFEEVGPQFVSAMRARARQKTGALRRAIKYRVLKGRLSLKVGLLDRNAPFYGRIQDRGRRAQVVTVRRFKRGSARSYIRGIKSGPGVISYPMRVRAMQGTRFVTGQFTNLRRALSVKLSRSFERGLRALSGGGYE